MGRSKHRQRHMRRLRRQAKIRAGDTVRFEHEGTTVVGTVITAEIDVTPWTATKPHVPVMLVRVPGRDINIAVFHPHATKLRPPPRNPRRLELWLAE